MDTRLLDYDYAPDFSKIRVGQVICVVVSPVCLDHDDGFHRMATIPTGVHCRFQGKLEHGMASYSFLRVRVVESTKIPLLALTEQSVVLGHPHATWQDSHTVIELCAGMGALGQGALSAGFETKAACELRSTIASLYNQQSEAPMVVGDIRDFSTVEALHKAHPRSSILAAGISCQPYSRLGDNKSGSDERAQTLPATLSCAHFLRSVVIVIECVEPAGQDAFVNWHINLFCIRTGFHRTEAILNLSDVWPCKRNRWWCILSAPAIGPIHFQALPKMFDLPSIRHVLPEFQKWRVSEEQQLMLSAIELEAFAKESGSAMKYLPNMKGLMPCALHAWGAQLVACPCGCRSEGLSSARLESRGLFGVLAPCLKLAERLSSHQSPPLRHLHPKEAALLCGLDPCLDWSDNLRLTLGAVGQLASPLHANWVFNHIKHGLSQAQKGWSEVQPVAELRAFRSWLLARAQIVWNFDAATPIPSEALELSGHWQSCAHATVKTLCETGGSLDSALRNLMEGANQTKAKEVDSVSDLTATQVMIPSQEGLPVDSPTSEVPSQEMKHDFAIRGVVATGHHLEDSDSMIQVSGSSTVGDVIRAEKNLAQWQYEVQCWSEGLMVDDSALLTPGMVLYISALGQVQPQVNHMELEERKDLTSKPESMAYHPLTQIKGDAFLQMLPPQVTKVCQAESLRKQAISSDARSLVLVNQNTIWGDDEILWQLQRVIQSLPEGYGESFGHIAVLDPLLATGWSKVKECSEIYSWYITNKNPQGILTSFVEQGHWIPVVLGVEDDDIMAFAVCDNANEEQCVQRFVKGFSEALKKTQANCTFEQTPFKHDCCGAFAIAFVEFLTTSKPLPTDVQELSNLHDHFRTLFMTTSQDLCPHPWIWGAGRDSVSSAVEKLSPFLKEKGVDPDQVQSRAQAAVKAIGALEVSKAIDSSTPWKSIKSLANNVKFQLVLQDELKKHIAKNDGKEVGKTPKHARANRSSKQPDQIVLDPSKLQIPNGAFCCEDTELHQLLPSQIGPIAMGVVVITVAEAEPFLKANQLVSSAPLALLVLNAPSCRWSTSLSWSKVTVPARCVMNQEPLLLEASLVQIGKGLVTKQHGPTNLAIETVQVSTIKVIVYKDEVQVPWDTFVGGPVKYIVSQLPILKLCHEKDCTCQCWHNPKQEQVSSAIVAVWRRQYLRQGFKPETPKAASIFTVCIRIPSSIRDLVIGAAGFGGVYVEPRSLDAKEIDRSFDVVWVPRADKSSVCHLRQTNPMVAGITRQGDRWGLRVPAVQAQTVHRAVRPDAVFLEQGPRLQHSVSPIPFGTDRQSLSRALKSSGWEVKPIQPVGSVEGGRGNTWNVVATKPPPSNIIPMSHGEVVISTVKAPERAQQEMMKPVAVSSTLNLCGAGKPQSQVGSKDPWVIQDPWQAYQGPRPEAGSRGAMDSAEGLKQLELKIEQAVLSKFPAQNMEQDDVPDRVAVLEKQVNTLMSKQQQMEVNLQEHHTHQAAQLSQLQGQLNAQSQQVSGQLEMQQQNIKNMFDSQMAQIRGLLAKRPREDGE